MPGEFRNHAGEIPDDYHGRYRHLVSLDEEGVPLILRIIDEGQLLKARGLKLAWLNEDILTRRAPDGETAMHAAANKGHLNQLPPQLLTTDTLTVRAKHGFSPFHAAALSGHLDQIPRHCWDEAFVFDRSEGCSVAHYASISMSILQFPHDLKVRRRHKKYFPEQWWRQHQEVIKARARMRRKAEDDSPADRPCLVGVILD